METTAVKRKITFFKKVGKNVQSIQSAASTWGELQEELPAQDIEVGDMKVVVAGLNVTLESKEAVIPLNDVLLFLFPKKVESGCGDYEPSNNGEGDEATGKKAEDFDYDEDDIDDFEFLDDREEIIVRLNLIKRGSEKNVEHADIILELVGNLKQEQPAAAELDPYVEELAKQASHLESTF